MIIEYAKACLGFKSKKKDPIDIANEFCEWARKNGRENLIIDLTNEIGFH